MGAEWTRCPCPVRRRTACREYAEGVATQDTFTSAQEPTRHLLEPLILVSLGLDEDSLDVRPKPRLTPIVARGALGQLCFVDAGRFDQRTSGRLVEARIVSRWKIVMAARHLAFRVVSKECA